ncbi:amino acid permease, partial [Anoxybacillus sp. LAT_38]|nr:amino acid permease [Anoxybacillus sp. LAT_38]
AASRIAYALSREGSAPRWFGRLHATYRTPVGGLAFLACCFAAVLGVLFLGWVDLARLIELPNATFFATYIGGCIAGVRLLHDSRIGQAAAWTSLAVTVTLYPFLGWSALYPLVIAAALLLWETRKKE